MTTQRFVVISDTHNRHNELEIPPCDFLIHCGDFTMSGKEHEVLDFLSWLDSLDHVKNKVFVAGNHELTLDPEHSRSDINLYSEILQLQLSNPSCIYLHNESVELDGVKFYGTPFSKKFGNWAFGYEEEEAFRIFEDIPADTDVIISHGPPFLIQDKAKHGNRDTGSAALGNRIVEVRPTFHFFGHIHESRGMKTNEGTLHVNASILDEKYNNINQPIVINWHDKKQITLDKSMNKFKFPHNTRITNGDAFGTTITFYLPDKEGNSREYILTLSLEGVIDQLKGPILPNLNKVEGFKESLINYIEEHSQNNLNKLRVTE